jgi:predicted transcriptional regulator
MEAAKKVRLQIHVEQDLADRIEHIAKRMNRSTSWLVAELLVQAVESRERFVDWLAWRTVQLLGWADPRKLCAKFGSNAPRVHEKGTVYVQTHVSAEIAEKIALLGAADQRSRADMATLLLSWLLDDEEWLLQAVTSKWYSVIHDAVQLPRGQQSAGNGEANVGRESDDQPEEQQPAREAA